MNEPREALQGEQKRRKQNALPLFLWDLERIKFQMKFPEIRRLEREFLIDPAFNEVMANLEIWNTGKFDQIAIDIETMRGRDNRPEEECVVCGDGTIFRHRVHTLNMLWLFHLSKEVNTIGLRRRKQRYGRPSRTYSSTPRRARFFKTVATTYLYWGGIMVFA